MVTTTSRRTLLHALTAAPVVAISVSVISPWSKALAPLHQRYEDEPATLVRTKYGREFSLVRYHRAEEFFATIEEGFLDRDFAHGLLYKSGVVAQLALSAHLLDVGFSDEWNARNIRQDISKGLAYANATGFGHDCPEMARLAVILSPYWKWRNFYERWETKPDQGGFTADQIRPLLRALLEKVHDVTGHPRPENWHLNRAVRS